MNRGLKITPETVEEVAVKIMISPSVHSLTKEIIDRSAGRDPVDAYYDVLLALKVIGARMHKAVGLTGMPHPL